MSRVSSGVPVLFGLGPTGQPTALQCDAQGLLTTAPATVTDAGGNPVAPQRATANVAAAQTDSVLVAAVPGKKVRVLAAFALAGGTATALTFNSKGAGAGTAISPLLANAGNGGFVLPFLAQGWFETNAGEALTVTTGAGSATGLLVIYALV